MNTTDNLYARLERINAMEARDPNRFVQNPRGPEFLTRRERYNELRWELQRRLRNAETIPGCVWRDAETPFASNH